MKDQLYKSFISYIEYAKPYLKFPALEKIEGHDQLHLVYGDRSSWLRSVIERVESSKEFNNLSTDFSIAFGGKSSRRPEQIRNYLRRSKLYLKIYEGKPVNTDEYFEHLWSVSNQRQVKTILLELVDKVCFSKPVIDFGKFKIQRFSKKALDNLVDNETNHIFYPYAELDTDILSKYWFIRKETFDKQQRLNLRSGITIDFGNENYFSRGSRTFPDMPLQFLTLFDWSADRYETNQKIIEEGKVALRFSIPLTLSVSSDVLAMPAASPNLSGLMLLPFCNEQGEEIGMEPEYFMHFDEGMLAKFKDTVEKSQRFLESTDLKRCKWKFIDIALGYLAKAYFTEGLEQLLWHMTVLEVLLGEKNKLMDSIRRRLGIIFGGRDQDKIKDIHQKFKELYDFRSNFVHGVEEGSKKVRVYHLGIARDFARKTVLWFITFLSFLHSHLAKKGVPLDKYPRQKELLFLIDFQIQELKREGYSINLPQDFPDIAIFGN